MKKQEKAGDVPLPLKATHKLKLLKYLAINTSRNVVTQLVNQYIFSEIVDFTNHQ